MASPIMQVTLTADLGVQFELPSLVPVSLKWYISADPLFQQIIHTIDIPVAAGDVVTPDFFDRVVNLDTEMSVYALYELTTASGSIITSSVSTCPFDTIAPPVINITQGVVDVPANAPIDITTGPYSPLSGAGGHASSDFIVVKEDFSASEYTQAYAVTTETVNILGITIPADTLEPNTNYILFARHNGSYKNGTFGITYFTTG